MTSSSVITLSHRLVPSFIGRASSNSLLTQMTVPDCRKTGTSVATWSARVGGSSTGVIPPGATRFFWRSRTSSARRVRTNGTSPSLILNMSSCYFMHARSAPLELKINEEYVSVGSSGSRMRSGGWPTMADGCRAGEIGMHWGSFRSVLRQNCEIHRGSPGRHIIYI